MGHSRPSASSRSQTAPSERESAGNYRKSDCLQNKIEGNQRKDIAIRWRQIISQYKMCIGTFLEKGQENCPIYCNTSGYEGESVAKGIIFFPQFNTNTVRSVLPEPVMGRGSKT